MKTIKIILVAVALFCTADLSLAQNINWRGINSEQNHLLNLNVGLDFASNIDLGYGYKLNTNIPILLNVEFSLPFGSNLLDDFKVKLGGQAELFTVENFSFTVKAYGVFRRYENSLTRLLNFGSEFSGVLGYYKPSWYLAAEFGFDKAVTTHVKHSVLTTEDFPDVKDGWYIPTAGNFFYGVQAGYSFESVDIYSRIGKTITQDLKTTALIPYYLQLGLITKF